MEAPPTVKTMTTETSTVTPRTGLRSLTASTMGWLKWINRKSVSVDQTRQVSTAATGTRRLSEEMMVHGSLRKYSFSTEGSHESAGLDAMPMLAQRSQSLWEQEKAEREMSVLFETKKKMGWAPWRIYSVCRKWLWRQLHASKGGLLWDSIQTVLSIVACVLYVVETYVGEETWILYVDCTTSAVFALDYFFNLIAAKNPIFFVLHPMAIIDVLTIVPIYVRLIFNASLSKLSFFRVFRILRLLRLMRALRIFKASKLLKRMGNINETWASNVRLLFGIGCGLFAFAAIMQQLESGEGVAPNDWSFHNSLYYIVVTISTVGYGDMSPNTIFGRLMCVFIILVTLVFVPIQLTRISEIVFESLQKKYKTPYKAKETYDHVIVLGSVSQQGLMDFMTEFFHEDHIDQRTKIVFLLPEMPADYIKQIMSNPDFEDRLHYIRGSALVDDDMTRAVTEQARAVFIFADKMNDPEEEDVANILRTLAFRHYGDSRGTDINSNTFIQINLAESKDKLISTGVQRSRVVCIEELQMAMFAVGSLYPGTQAFIGNLLRSYKSPEGLNAADSWFQDYSKGCEYEVYKVRLPDSFRRKNFTEMALRAYNEFGVFLFGVEVEVTDGFRVVLNPAQTLDGRKLKWPKGGLYGFVLACHFEETIPLQFDGFANPLLQKGGRYRSQGLGQQNADKRNSYPAPSQRHRARSSVMSTSRQEEFLSEMEEEEEEVENIPHLDIQKIEKGQPYLRGVEASLRAVEPQKFATSADCLVGFDVGEDILRPKWPSGRVETMIDAESGKALVRGHIVVTGTWRSQDKLFEMLRVDYRLQRPIVILNQCRPDDDMWRVLCEYPYVYYLQGSAGQYEDLARAAIYTAHSVVVFRNDIEGGLLNSTEAHLADADTVLSVLTIRNALAKNPHLHSRGKNPWIPMICEFGFSSNIQYVEPKTVQVPQKKSSFFSLDIDSEEENPTNTSMYASGSVFLFSILDTLLCQSYYSRRLLLVIQELVGNEPHSDRLKAIGMRKSRFYQVRVPKEYVGFTFRELMVCFLRDFDTICLGLYRFDLKGDDVVGEISPAPYVVTCPRKDLVLRSNDSVFILSQNIRTIKTKYNV